MAGKKRGPTEYKMTPTTPGRVAEAAVLPVRTREGKVRKEYWLNPALVEAARDALGATTERDAVEMALDLVVFRKELVDGIRALRGARLSRLD